ncbi:CHAT domain-containing protein [filamentous cyanobacterium LEGE 11480]|uniref:CHAT domain-containing protein n=1 Tax=Romeriopsis navalis LEGE 11480 TaxID=2777977 RepID=A0A928VK72_9CYAN|nr:CHAT domain-containing protein [Romeriopsis navalis]MBE9029157.1 CHAT domain-containing protein [Romeriopsis navalis LEGE 11480]
MVVNRSMKLALTLLGLIVPLLTRPLMAQAHVRPILPPERSRLQPIAASIRPSPLILHTQSAQTHAAQLLAQGEAQSGALQSSKIAAIIKQIMQLRAAAVKATNERRYGEAIQHYQQVLRLFQRYQYQPGIAMTQWKLGTLYHEQKQYPQALKVLAAAATTVQGVKNPTLAAQIYTSQRLAYTELGQQQLAQRKYDQALQVFQQGLRVSKRARDISGQVLSLIKIAEVYRAQQLYRQALPSLKVAHRLVQQDDAMSQNVVLMVLGRTYDDLSEFPQALTYYQQALKSAVREQDVMQVAGLENNIATIYLNQGNYRAALKRLNQSLKIAQQSRQLYAAPVTVQNLDRLCQTAKTNPAPPFKFLSQFCATRLPRTVLAEKTNIVFQGYWRMIVTLEGNVLNNIGTAESSLGQYDSAIARHQQSLKVHKPLQDLGRDATSWNNIGNVHLARGQYTQALSAYETSLKLVRQVGNRNQEASTMSNMAQVYQAQGQVARSIKLVQQVLPMVRSIEDKQQEATLLSNLGSSYAALADYVKAEAVIQQGLKLHRRVGSLSGEATALNNLAIVTGQRGEYETAIRLHQQSLTIAQRIGDRHKAAANLANLGRTYTDLAQYAQGIDYYQQALAVHQDLGSQSWVLSTQANLAGMYRTLGQNDKALALYQSVAQQAQRLGESMTTGIALVGSATIWLEQADYESAQQALQQALKLHRSAGAKRAEIYALRALGKLQAKQGKPGRAIATLQTALGLTQAVGPLEKSLTLQDLAQVQFERGDYNAAQTMAKQAMTIAQSAKYQDILGTVLTWLGRAQFANNQVGQAITPLQQAVAVWEGLRPGLKDSDKVSLFDTQAQTYQALQQALVAQGKPEQALEIAERGRARAFVELFATKMGQVKTALTSPNLSQIKALAQQQQATLVEYSQIDDRTVYIWVIKPNGDVVFRESRLPPKTRLAQMVQQSRYAMGVRSRTSITLVDTRDITTDVANVPMAAGNLAALHRILIAPIAQDLPRDSTQKVIFMPQGSLFYVPFAALEDAAGKVLLEKHTIAVAPSIQSLALTAKLKQRDPGQGATLIVGNPTMPSLDGLTLAPLPGAEREAKAVGTMLNITPLIGAQATKAAVLQQITRAPIVHFATHGLLDTFRGDVPGAVVLARGKSEAESLLTASEIADLKLQADLVVLSACSTGKGDITGDGVIGLSRSLFLAGVPSVIVSLWDVDDAATAKLMTAFYRNWQTQKMDKAQALRQAMLETREAFPNPQLWAAFNLVGESR